MDRWLEDSESEEMKRKKEEIYNDLSDEKKLELKKQKITSLVKRSEDRQINELHSDEFLENIKQFKDWLNIRSYLYGDIDKIEIWIENLYRLLKAKEESLSNEQNLKNKLQTSYREIPPNFLDEKTRVALSKKLRGIKKTNSDNYYLRKLNSIIKEKLKEAQYYEILKDILDM